MAGLGPAIHDFGSHNGKSWIPAPRAGMTKECAAHTTQKAAGMTKECAAHITQKAAGMTKECAAHDQSEKLRA